MQQTVLITGATDGIGLALAQQYQARGARLVLVGRRSLETLDSGLFTDATYCRADLVQADAAALVARFLETHAMTRLDLVIHNAALGAYTPIEQQPLADIRTILTVNLYAPVVLTHVLLPHLTAAHGKLVFISSVASALPSPQYAVYGASKAALDGLARNLRSELRGSVSVQLVRPGATRTGMHRKSNAPLAGSGWERYPSAEHVAAQIMRAIDRGRPSVTIGLQNQLLRAGGRYIGWLLDRIVERRL